MSNDKNDFPAYRKFKGINVWFKIINDRQFTELKQIGSKFVVHEVKAQQYPEMVLIQDMLNCHEDRWEIVSSDFFEQKVNS